MRKAFDGYRRLGRGMFSCSSLWLGAGHLLYVKGAGFLVPFTEEYLRFEMTRIQAVSIIRTRTGMVLTLLLAASLLASGALAAGAGWEAARTVHDGRYLYMIGAVIFAVPAVISLVALIIHLALGPTCLLQVQTRVRSERLRPFRRLRSARRLMKEIGPLVAAGQESLLRPAVVETPVVSVEAAEPAPVLPRM